MIRHDVEQGSHEWLKLRIGIPTASQFSRIITPTLKPSTSAATYRSELLVEWLLGEPMDSANSQYMQRGSQLEVEAVAWYELVHGCVVDRVGFVTTDDGTIGCSPDSLIGDDGGLEIKCLSAVNHVSALLDVDDNHKAQVQGGLYVTGRKWWDRVYYHPSFPPVAVRYERDEAFIAALHGALTQFVASLEAAKEILKSKGCTPKPVQHKQEYCTHVRDDGRHCMSKANLAQTADGWRCGEHREA